MSESARSLSVSNESKVTGQEACAQLLKALDLETGRFDRKDRAAIEAMAREILTLREDRNALAAQLEQAELLADRDPLCPVFNRRAFHRELSREIALAERYGTALCLIYIDLDRFKLVNDRFGHATGDKVIRHVAQTLIDELRQTDITGRLGGDEFAVALTHAELEDARQKAASLEALLGSLVVRDAMDSSLQPVSLGASCGVVRWRRGLTAAALIAEADEKMFLRKQARRKETASK